jgi:predicted RNA-binding Zn ribbon-like protein
VSRRRPPQYDLPKAAPEPLRLVQKLVNTRDAEYTNEWLGTPGELSTWLREHGLPVGRVTSADVERVQRVREALRQLVIVNNHGGAGDYTVLDHEAAHATLCVSFDPPGLVPAARGIDGALAQIFGIVHEAMRDGTWQRLKGCRNCHWAFYDESKNRSATWCSMELCGNRLKTKRYRKRHTAASI